MPIYQQKSSPRGRQFPRFALRTLMVVVALIAVLFTAITTWCRFQEAEYQRQREVAGRIAKHGGIVVWSMPKPNWVKWICDPEICRRVISVNFDGRTDIDTVFNALCELPDCHAICTSADSLSDLDVQRLADAKQVQTITVIDDRPTVTIPVDVLRKRLPRKSIDWKTVTSPYGAF